MIMLLVLAACGITGAVCYIAGCEVGYKHANEECAADVRRYADQAERLRISLRAAQRVSRVRADDTQPYGAPRG